MENKLIKCSRIAVSCVANDPVDIRCGGPEYLGFDFNVIEKNTEEMKKFITLTLETLEISLAHLYVRGTIEVEAKKVWDKNRIVEAIQKDANYLKSDEVKNYFIRGAVREENLTYPNTLWGFGKLSLQGVFDSLAGL